MKRPCFAIQGSLPSQIGKSVHFNPPQSMRKPGVKSMTGRIIDEVWADKQMNSHVPREAINENDWGDYSFCAQLIQFDDEQEPLIRLAYFRRPAGESFWKFASQMTVTACPETVKALLERVLEKKEWFSRPK